MGTLGGLVAGLAWVAAVAASGTPEGVGKAGGVEVRAGEVRAAEVRAAEAVVLQAVAAQVVAASR